ncbi:hypothetical protein ACFOQM_10990 [Paenibacillus sp. GCM10012307]|uniref:Nucleotide kinase n=1 Tax=Paenibacillus roseus TaxID=2798579 RepID=A0A934MP86_9BACL|nr:hypothetical protein [Paenibacillus roseus]MBJ6361811.1 hypothetical protein [Paenibacillus roseus]
MTKRLHFFARGNTAEGLYSLNESVYEDAKTVYVLEGYPGGTSEALQQVAEAWNEKEWRIHWIHQPLDSELLEGIILPDYQLAIVDGEAWDGKSASQGATVRTIDLSQALREDTLSAATREAITALEREIERTYAAAYALFQRTLQIHDEWEVFYIEALDRDIMNSLAAEWTNRHLTPPVKEKTAKVSHRFLGAATWKGAVDYVLNLTDEQRTRVFVKGRPGSGKSTLFKKLAAAAAGRGIDVEVYHCGFDPNSLDMLIFPELSLAIFDSTAPHEHFPVREGDSILDVYGLAIPEGTDEKHLEALAEVSARYKSSMQQSIALLADAKELRSQLEELYKEAADPTVLSRIGRDLVLELEHV